MVLYIEHLCHDPCGGIPRIGGTLGCDCLAACWEAGTGGRGEHDGGAEEEGVHVRERRRSYWISGIGRLVLPGPARALSGP
jgi:hypothetical protein